MKNLEEFMKAEGWILKWYSNDCVPYGAWHKDGFQIEEGSVDEIDTTQEWEDD